MRGQIFQADGCRSAWRGWLAALVLPLLMMLGACTVSPPPATPVAAAPVETAAPSPTSAPTAAPTPSPTAVVAVATATNPPPTSTLTPAALLSPSAPTPAPTIPPPSPTAVPSPTPAPPPVVAGLPQRIRIPRLRIDTLVEHVGLTADGAMDVPKRYDTVGWYSLGARPGQPGNAVIAGHLDSKTGPAIFWRLRELRGGDEVIITSDDGVERRFVVREMASYPYDEAPLDRIFGPTDALALNLITCGGTFDRSSQNYDQRLVVYTTLAA